ncbi:hypothetical protein DLAC_04715 [Tieghemostelium lacteum]|uniref:Armadillo-like helical domain-containing protein n=1 Tax=Tieghemostelium lacteum TaxID=361077 RepID=A0A151ZKJ0_TIELA|nr:hypothetical protein DLAC_04715 [Tieghemostelium lacteum]|eukprot:KYQ94419.1 hypothetical protein DLAC_04715 [Tieghemostelium lacteum]
MQINHRNIILIDKTEYINHSIYSYYNSYYNNFSYNRRIQEEKELENQNNSDSYQTRLNLYFYNNHFNQSSKTSDDCQPLCFCYHYLYRGMILSVLLDFPYGIDSDTFILKEYDRLKMLQEQQGPKHTEILLRREDSFGGRKALKEKFVEIYEALFNGEDPSQGQPQFWEQLFLIKVNIPFLERCIILTSEDHLLALKPNLNKIFTQSCLWLKDTSTLRLVHVIETLSILLKSIFRKKFNNFGFDILNILCGIENADQIITDLMKDLDRIMADQSVELKVKVGVVNLLNIISTATDFINQNTLLQYLMIVDIFPTLMNLLMVPELPKDTARIILCLICQLCNYQKYEIHNPYHKNLSTGLTEQDKLARLASVITDIFRDQNEFYQEQYREPNSTLYSRVGGYLSSWVYTPKVVHSRSFYELGSALTILFELFHHNEQFIQLVIRGTHTDTLNNLIKQFFTYCSYLASDTQKDSKILFSKISITILIIMSECKELEDYFHDVKSTCYIFIFSKRALYPDPKEIEKNPLSIHVVELLSQFIKCNLKGKISMDIHQCAVDCLQRIVSYEKKTQTRLNHKWNDTWNSLFSLIGLVPTLPNDIQKTQSMHVAISAVNIFNLFINYGDSFLSSPNDYSDLFYEIIRSGKVFDNLYQYLEGVDPNLTISLHNIKIIIQHFNEKLQQWSVEHPEVTLTSIQVSKVINENFGSLKLKLQENLDVYEPYVENQKESLFFRHFTKDIILDLKKQIPCVNL